MLRAGGLSVLSRVAAAVMALAVCAVCIAQDSGLVASGSLDLPGDRNHVTHGWFVIPNEKGGVLVHLPPRKRAGIDGRSHGSVDGAARHGVNLERPPVAMAAVRQQVYMVFETRDSGGELLSRTVGSVSVSSATDGDFWFVEPPDRTRVEASLPATGELAGFVGSGAGPAALIDEGERGVSLRVLRGSAWAEALVPARARVGKPRLIGLRNGIGLLSVEPSGVGTLWVGTLRAPAPTSYDADEEESDRGTKLKGAKLPTPQAEIEWTTRRLCSDGSLSAAELASAAVYEIGGVLTYIVDRGSTVVIGTLTEDHAIELSQLDGLTTARAVVPLDGVGRVGVVWLEGGVAGKKNSSRPMVAEVSAYDGSVIYRGPAVDDGPVSARQVQLLMVVLVTVTTVVLLLVLRGEDGAYHLPAGVSLAPPSRRVLAALIDFLVATGIACRIADVPMAELFSPAVILAGRSMLVLGLTVATAVVLGSLSEWMFGRTIGKLLADCEVVDVAEAPKGIRRPKLWQACVRNLVVWVAPPAAALGLMEAGGRHRGDALSKTAVVVRDPEVEQE